MLVRPESNSRPPAGHTVAELTEPPVRGLVVGVVDLDQIVYLKERGVITEGGVGRVHFQFILIPVNLQSLWS